MSGKLYIVATPIGNLGDITQRALDVLRSVACIAAEDTRHSRKLLQHYGIETPLHAYHDFSEAQKAGHLLDKVGTGSDLALISDAGTPLISDPGYQLVREAHRRGIAVVPVPGASAAIAALSAAGIASDRFTFEGFLPARQPARRAVLEGLAQEPRTMIFYEAPHRIVDCLQDMRAVFGADRDIALARELTKTFETIVQGSLDAVCAFVSADPNQQKGEIVLVLAGLRASSASLDARAIEILRTLMEELPLKKAAVLTARLTGIARSDLYDAGLRLQGKLPEQSPQEPAQDVFQQKDR